MINFEIEKIAGKKAKESLVKMVEHLGVQSVSSPLGDVREMVVHVLNQQLLVE